VLAVRRRHHLAGDELLDEVAGGPLVAPGHGGGAGRAFVLAVDAGDAPAQGGELFLDLLHASLFLCSV